MENQRFSVQYASVKTLTGETGIIARIPSQTLPAGERKREVEIWVGTQMKDLEHFVPKM